MVSIDSSKPEYGPFPIGICVGRYPYFANQGASILGSTVSVINSHAKSLFFDASGIPNNHPPLNVE